MDRVFVIVSFFKLDFCLAFSAARYLPPTDEISFRYEICLGADIGVGVGVDDDKELCLSRC